MNLCKNCVNPFLRRMGEGPIEWKVWDDETIKRAEALDRPVCLCLINSASRWSGAMEANFDEPEIIRMLNNDFVPVLADSADVPHLTLAARALAQIMLGHAGWPLFVFMSPQKKPFFASAYMPQSCEDSRTPGLLQVLRRIKWLWLMKRPQIDAAADSCAAQLAQVLLPYTAPLEANIAGRAASQLLEDADAKNGGFGGAPKFPQAPKLLLAAALCELGAEKEKLRVLLEKSLTAMFAGGLYDHLDGGFHDYCGDGEWQQPYLGKHLGPNCAILDAYLEGYRLFGNPLYRHVVEKSAASLAACFDCGDGLLYSGEDVHDSQTVDSYYLWRFGELKDALGGDAENFCGAHGAIPEGNYRDPLTRLETGKNILTPSGLPVGAAEDEETSARRADDFARKREKLRVIRAARQIPELEKRVSTRENASFAAVLAKASRLFEQPEYLERSGKIMKTLLNYDENLPHFLYGGAPDGTVVLDDAAAAACACVELYKSTGAAEWLESAKGWCKKADNLFGETDAMRLVAEGTCEILPAWDAGDDYYPSGSGLMANCLVSLGEITGDSRWKERAEKIVRAFGGALNEYPAACAALTIAALRLQADEKK